MSQAGKLRTLLQSPGLVMAPGAYDAWSARLIEKAGFEAVYMTGFGVSAGVLGRPDIGLLSLPEMAAMARNIAQAIDIPLIADADTGYGGTLNVIRTVREYEMSGVAAIQLEDQVMPKRCGHMEGKQLVPTAEMVAKVRAAVYARREPETVIIARTDARAVEGFDEAIARAGAYAEAGADVLFFEAPQSAEEVRSIAGELKIPLLANMVENGKTPLFSRDELVEMGYKIAIYPTTPIFTVTKSLSAMLSALRAGGGNHACAEHYVDFPTFNTLVGLAEQRDLESSFAR